MRTAIIGIVALGLATACAGRAQGWAHAGRYGTASGGGGSWQAHGWAGGSASGGGGSWSGHSAYGGSASGGDGSWHATGAQGGTASGGDGSWNAHGAYGGTASGGDGSWQAHDDGTTVYGGYDHNYYGGTYSTYHPPTVVNEYGGGCYDCGGWDTAGAAAVGVAAGVAVGAAVANSANTTAYDEGVAAGSAYAMNAIYPKLPASGCTYTPVAGATYYLCNGIWFSPSYGANGVYYRVVPAP